VHINALVLTRQNLDDKNSKIYTHKYFVHVQRLLQLSDRERALTYINKEMQSRPFVENQDYIKYVRS